jgi:hypothetical protein
MAGTFRDSEARAALTYMAQVWLRLADDYANERFRPSKVAEEGQPVVQQQNSKSSPVAGPSGPTAGAYGTAAAGSRWQLWNAAVEANFHTVVRLRPRLPTFNLLMCLAGPQLKTKTEFLLRPISPPT